MQSFRNRQAHSCLWPDKNVARDRQQARPREQERCHQRNGGSQTLGSTFSDPGAPVPHVRAQGQNFSSFCPTHIPLFSLSGRVTLHS